MLRSFFLKRLVKNFHPPLIGIDISDSYVKCLTLRDHNGKGYLVEFFGISPLERGVVVEKEIKDSCAVAGAIKKALCTSPSYGKFAAVAIASRSVMTKIIQVDLCVAEEEIEELAMLEASKMVSYPQDKILLDFQKLGSCNDVEGKQDILLVIAREEIVNQYASALKTAGLIPKIVEVESCVMSRITHLMQGSLPANMDSETIAVIDIGNTNTTMTVFCDRVALFTSSERFDGRDLTLPNVAKHIRQIFQVFASSDKYRKINCIILAGDNAGVIGLAPFIERLFAVNTIVSDPIINMTFSKQVDEQELNNLKSGLTMCCTLASRCFDLKGLNLLPWREALREKKKHKFFVGLASSGILALIFVSVFAMCMSRRIHQQNATNAHLKSEIKLFAPKVIRTKGLKKQKLELLKRIQTIRSLEAKRRQTISFYNVLVQIVPEGVFLKGVSQEANKVTLYGNAQSNKWVSRLIKNIELSKWLSKPTLTEIKSNNDKNYNVDFVLQFIMRSHI